jgi:DNA-binding LacI/PurR family transcriptional regulator
METVAALAGVSAATVSRVLNGSARVSPPVRAAVQSAVEYLGYVPNKAARSLVTRRSDSVALVVREPLEFGVTDPYLSKMIVASSQSAVRTGRQLVVLIAQDDEAHDCVADHVKACHIDGVVLSSVHADDPLPQQLHRAGIPLVICGRPAPHLHGFCSVDVDNLRGGRMATRRLLETGRRTIATITGPTDMTVCLDRLQGFRETLYEAGRTPEFVAHGDFTRQSGERAMRDLLQREPGLDGVFVASDLMALGAIRVLRSAGRRIPEDVAVVGFDDIELSQHTDPPLTTVRQPVAEQAAMLMDCLVHQIVDGTPVGPRILAPDLVVRQSG